MNERFMISQDDDGHWYLFSVGEKDLFDELVEDDGNELTAESAIWLDKRRIDGPHRLTFTNPEY